MATDRARALSYGCRCSRARLVGILEGFPADDLDHMAVDGDIVMTCEFCNFDFRFPRQDVRGPRRARMLTRRGSLLLPLLLAGCGGGAERSYPPLRYDYLTPLRLNVAAIQIEQRFVPSGVPPDVTQDDPMPPARALRAMAEDRLQSLGSADRAVFIIQDASLVRRRDTLSGNLSVNSPSTTPRPPALPLRRPA